MQSRYRQFNDQLSEVGEVSSWRNDGRRARGRVVGARVMEILGEN